MVDSALIYYTGLKSIQYRYPDKDEDRDSECGEYSHHSTSGDHDGLLPSSPLGEGGLGRGWSKQADREDYLPPWVPGK